MKPNKFFSFSTETSIKSLNKLNLFNTNETISESLLEKFNNISCANYERIIKKVTVIKEPNVHKPSAATTTQNSTKENFVSAMGRYFSHLAVSESTQKDDQSFTLGISIVQGSDGNVYVKDIAKGGPGAKAGVEIGDQILAVNGSSLLNVPYETSIKVLQKTNIKCELVISRLIYCAQPVEHKNPTKSRSKSKSRSITSLNGNNLLSEHLTRLELENNVQNCTLSPYQSPMEKYNFQQADEDEDFNEEKYFKNPDLIVPVLQTSNLKTFSRYPMLLSPAKSLPEIPIQKTGTAVPRSMGLSRKYVGPVKYPVTPAKGETSSSSTLQTPSKQNSLSLFTSSNESSHVQVYI